ncbi:MAG: hypothetical protein H0U67_03915 [Gemmatimonadetes bacterium]|nr:hypothetical protein [Gemmatimonadota bacterium]
MRTASRDLAASESGTGQTSTDAVVVPFSLGTDAAPIAPVIATIRTTRPGQRTAMGNAVADASMQNDPTALE